MGSILPHRTTFSAVSRVLRQFLKPAPTGDLGSQLPQHLRLAGIIHSNLPSIETGSELALPTRALFPKYLIVFIKS